MSGFFDRTEALFGSAALERLKSAKVAVVGVGGVGGWCAEALVRTGLGSIVIIDDDLVATSNVNRQSHALASTVGMIKVEAMKERLLAINPDCAVEARDVRYTGGFPFKGCDVVVDAIDSVDCKAELINAVTAEGVKIVSSMGAAFRTDPSKVAVTRFEKVEGDALAKALRARFKRKGKFPSSKFQCVWSAERPCRTSLPGEEKGSSMAVTATFGMCLASEVVRMLTAPADVAGE